MNTSSLTALLWFIGVICLIPLLLWLVKRSPIGSTLSNGPVKQVGALPLSPTQRLVTVEVGHGDDRLWLVLGVTPGSISTLYTMEPQSTVLGGVVASDTTPQTTFAQLLQRMQGRGPHAR